MDSAQNIILKKVLGIELELINNMNNSQVGLASFYLPDNPMSLLEKEIKSISQKIESIEEQIPKKPKWDKPTDPQRFLLAYYHGCIDSTMQNNTISQTQKYFYISGMLGIHPDNVRKFVSETSKEERPLLNRESTYKFLVETFEKTGYPELATKARKILLEIQRKKGK